MKLSRIILVSILLPLGAQCALAGDRGGDQVLGGVVGGVLAASSAMKWVGAMALLLARD